MQDKFKLLGVILDFRAHIKEQLKKSLRKGTWLAETTQF